MNIGPDFLAEVGHFIDERDLGSQKGIAGIFNKGAIVSKNLSTYPPEGYNSIHIKEEDKTKKTSGRLTLVELQRMFPNNERAKQWFIENRWPHGLAWLNTVVPCSL